MPDQSPLTRVVVKKLTVTSGTLSTAPLKTTLDLGDVAIERIQIRIPAGHASQTGIAVVYDGQGIMPWATPPDWLIGDAEVFGEQVDFHVGHPLQVWQYNTGIFDHAHYLRFVVTDFVERGSIPTPVLVSTIPGGTSDAPIVDTTSAGDVSDELTVR